MYWIYVFIFGIYNVNTYVYKFIFIILQFWKISHNLYLYYVTKPFGHGILDTPYQLLWLIKTSSIWRKFIFEGRFPSKRMIFYIKKIYLHFCCLDTFLLSSQKNIVLLWHFLSQNQLLHFAASKMFRNKSLFECPFVRLWNLSFTCQNDQ